MKRVILFSVIAIFAVLSASQASAQISQHVRFAAGTHGTTVRGTVRGYAYRDYVVRASGGQKISLRLTPNGLPSVFTVFLPGGGNMDRAAETDKFSGTLPSTGEYVIRVGMMRAYARRRGSVSNFSLRITIR
jgi:hypothetical protein